MQAAVPPVDGELTCCLCDITCLCTCLHGKACLVLSLQPVLPDRACYLPAQQQHPQEYLMRLNGRRMDSMSSCRMGPSLPHKAGAPLECRVAHAGQTWLPCVVFLWYSHSLAWDWLYGSCPQHPTLAYQLPHPTCRQRRRTSLSGRLSQAAAALRNTLVNKEPLLTPVISNNTWRPTQRPFSPQAAGPSRCQSSM